MQKANYKMLRFWHFHSDRTRAGPTRLQSWLWGKRGKVLRTASPTPPPPYSISPLWRAVKPEIAKPSPRDAAAIEDFLEKHYKSKSGFKYVKGITNWLTILLNPQNVVVLLKNPEGQICGCVASVALCGMFGFTRDSAQVQPREVKYLCIHPLLGKRGLAGWLLGWLDTLVHEVAGPTVHVGWWFAPPPRVWSPLPSVSYMRLFKKIFARQSLRAHELEKIQEVSEASANRVITEIVSNKEADYTIGLGLDFDLFIAPMKGVRWWKYQTDEMHGCSLLVGLVQTSWEAPEGSVWQVVYCSYVRGRPGNDDDISMPFWDTSEETHHYPKTAIEMAIIAQGVRVAVISDMPSQYGLGREPYSWRGWNRMPEISKFHIYNWMPPGFGLESLLCLTASI